MADIPFNEDGTRETPAQTFQRLREKNRKPPKNFSEKGDPVRDEEETQKERFRKAAVECAQLEGELVGMFDRLPWKPSSARGYYRVEAESGVSIEKGNGYTAIVSYKENIRKLNEKPVRVEFTFGQYNTEAKRLGVNTDRKLSIWFHGDESTREEYERLTEKNPDSSDATAITDYYFAEDGKLMKTLNMSASVPVDPERNPYDWGGIIVYFINQI